MNKRQEEIRQAAEDNCLDLSHCTYFEMGAEWADQHPHWISVEDELPEVGEPVLFYALCMDESLRGAYQKNGTWWSIEYECKFINGVTHWMPLPPAPKKGGEE